MAHVRNLVGVTAVIGLLVGLGSGTGTGCAKDPEDYCEGCTNAFKNTWACYRLGSYGYDFLGGVCMPPGSSLYAVGTSCETHYGYSIDKIEPVPCPGQGYDTGSSPIAGPCDTWEPSAYVTYYSQYDVYAVADSFFASLVDDPLPLSVCDTARIEYEERDGKYYVQNAVPEDFLYEIGLRNGDRPISINSIPLDEFEDAANAFGSLWLYDEETQFQLLVRRGANNITLNIWIVGPSFGE